MQKMKHHNRGGQYLQMKRLGMSNAFFVCLNIKQAMKECLWLLPGMVAGYAIGVVLEDPYTFDSFKEGNLMTESFITGEYTDDKFMVLADLMINNFTMRNVAIIGGSILVIMLLIILITTCTATKAIGKEEKVS